MLINLIIIMMSTVCVYTIIVYDSNILADTIHTLFVSIIFHWRILYIIWLIYAQVQLIFRIFTHTPSLRIRIHSTRSIRTPQRDHLLIILIIFILFSPAHYLKLYTVRFECQYIIFFFTNCTRYYRNFYYVITLNIINN